MIKKNFTILLAIAIFSFANCKKKPVKPALYKGFVIAENGVAVYKKPGELKSKAGVIPKNSEFQVLEDKIPDPKVKDKKYWYEVNQGKISGYISYDEALINRSISVFTGYDKPTGAVVTASSLNMREKPNANAKVVSLLQRLELVEVISQGSVMESIKDKYDRWIEIKTSQGKIGFVFAGYTNIYPLEEAKKAQERKEIQYSGYFLVNSDSPKYWSAPGGELITQAYIEKSESYISMDGFPSKGEFGVVASMAQYNGKTYYKVEMNSFEYGGGMNAHGWIEESEGKYYSEVDFSDYTFKSANTNIDPSIVSLIKQQVSQAINFNGTTLVALDFQEPEKNKFSFYLLKAAYGYQTKKGFGDYHSFDYIIKQEAGVYTLVSSALSGSLKIKDLDSDGIPEIITEVAERAESSTTLWGYIDGSYKSIKVFSSMPSQTGESHYAEVIDAENLIKVSTTIYDEKTGEVKTTEQKYKYEKGNLISL